MREQCRHLQEVWWGGRRSEHRCPGHLRNSTESGATGKGRSGQGWGWGQKGLQGPAQDRAAFSWLCLNFHLMFDDSQACASSPSDKLHCHTAKLASLFWGAYITSFSTYLEVDFNLPNWTLPYQQGFCSFYFGIILLVTRETHLWPPRSSPWTRGHAGSSHLSSSSGTSLEWSLRFTADTQPRNLSPNLDPLNGLPEGSPSSLSNCLMYCWPR